MNPQERHDELEQRAGSLLVRVVRLVLRSPDRRVQILAHHLWGADGAAAWSLRQGAAAVDSTIPGRNPPAPTLRDRAESSIARDVAQLRYNGVEVIEIDGRWHRRGRTTFTLRRSDWTPVLTPAEKVQLRLARAELAARRSTERLARHLDVAAPPRGEQRSRARAGRDVEWSDPRLEQHWRQMVANAAGRIAHDEAIDAFRDGVFDRLEQRDRTGWIRKAERTACAACLALADGQVHTDRIFWRHTRCRCVPWPETRGWRPPTGQEIWDSLPPAEQDELFHHRGGAAKAQMLRDGLIRLTDLLQVDYERAAVTDYVVTERPLSDFITAGLVPAIASDD